MTGGEGGCASSDAPKHDAHAAKGKDAAKEDPKDKAKAESIIKLFIYLIF